jgi:hypothetical protein
MKAGGAGLSARLRLRAGGLWARLHLFELDHVDSAAGREGGAPCSAAHHEAGTRLRPDLSRRTRRTPTPGVSSRQPAGVLEHAVEFRVSQAPACPVRVSACPLPLLVSVSREFSRPAPACASIAAQTISRSVNSLWCLVANGHYPIG